MTARYTVNINWKNIRGVIFDVDGTLYDQRRLRLIMLAVLTRHAIADKNGLNDIRILRRFRKVREDLADREIAGVSDCQLKMVAGSLCINSQKVADIVEEWIYRKPLDYIFGCRFPLVDLFFESLKRRGIRIGIFSDYPIEDKLTLLKLKADATCYSLESHIDRLKPQTAGLETIVERLSLDKSECVFIGDRDSRDGACARRLGVPFILCRGRDFYRRLVRDLEVLQQIP